MKRISILAAMLTAAILFTQCTDEKKSDADDVKPTFENLSKAIDSALKKSKKKPAAKKRA